MIAGATSVAQVEANVAAGSWRLARRRMTAVDAIAETLMCGRLNVSSGPLTMLFMDMVSQPYPAKIGTTSRRRSRCRCCARRRSAISKP